MAFMGRTFMAVPSSWYFFIVDDWVASLNRASYTAR
jgi:hypothetical protein